MLEIKIIVQVIVLIAMVVYGIVRYLYNRFSQDGYASYNNMLAWLTENNIEYSTYWNV